MLINLISIEAYSLLILFVLILCCFFERKFEKRTVSGLLVLLIGGSVPLFFDMLSYILDYFFVANETLLSDFSIISFIAPAAAYITFAHYFLSVLNTKKPIKPFFFHLTYGLSAGIVFTLLIASCLGYAFSFQDGVYVPGPLSSLNGIFTIVLMITFFVLTIYNRKSFSITEFIGTILYTIIPILTSLVLIIFGQNPSYIYVATTLSSLIIFTLMQNTIFTNAHLREELLVELSQLDTLTKIGNRHSFEIKIDELKSKDNICVIFSDINCLKVVNDTKGHLAGDELIKRFVSIALSHFRKEDLFRISGDEFVFLIPYEEEEVMKLRVQGYLNDIDYNDEIASVGYVIGKNGTLLETIKLAEEEMYIHKKEYHERTGYHR